MSDQDDLVRGNQSPGHLFIEGCLFRYALTFIMSFLTVNQVAMKVVRIVGGDSGRILRSTLTEIAKDMRGVVIDDDHHSTRLNEFAGGRFRSGLFEEFPETRHLLDAELARARSFENLA